MQDYLSQLINRVQQPALTVQPRPVSRFESPRHPAVESFDSTSYSESFELSEESPEFFRPPESAAAGESGGPEVRSAPSGRFVTGMEIDESIQPTESNRHESGITDALFFRDSPAVQSSMLSHMSRPVFARQPMRETDSIAASHGHPAELNEQTVQTEQIVPVSRATAGPTRSVMQQENAAEKATIFLNNALSEQPEHPERIKYVTQRRQERIEPDTRPNTIARRSTNESNPVSADLSIYPSERQNAQQILPESAESPVQGRRAPHQPSATLNELAAIPNGDSVDTLPVYPQPAVRNQSHIRIKEETAQPLISPVSAESPEREQTSPDSTPVVISLRERPVSKIPAKIEPLPEWGSDSISRSDFSSTPRRAIFKQPFAEPDALRHSAEQAADTPIPTIQVTIGRIEVRATVAVVPTSARKAPARSSTMSLDDYLKQRSGRSR